MACIENLIIFMTFVIEYDDLRYGEDDDDDIQLGAMSMNKEQAHSRPMDPATHITHAYFYGPSAAAVFPSAAAVFRLPRLCRIASH